MPPCLQTWPEYIHKYVLRIKTIKNRSKIIYFTRSNLLLTPVAVINEISYQIAGMHAKVF